MYYVACNSVQDTANTILWHELLWFNMQTHVYNRITEVIHVLIIKFYAAHSLS